ncbi:hypothetical protein Ae201684P_004434 [Aphanomyces euteiches]|nr:hypothetical protein Ae201684P_004434 [Aphanomyces euteiches]
MDSDADMPHQALPSTDISTGIGAIPLVPTETIANSQNDQEDSATLSNQIQHNTAFNPHSEQALPSGSSFTASSGDGKLNKAHHQELNDAKLDGQDGTISASNNAFGNNSPSTKTPAIPTVSPQDAASHESELKGTDADSGRSPDIRSSRRRKRPESMPSSPGSRMKKHLKVDSSDSPRLALSPQIIVVDDEEEATYSESFREAARAVAGLRRQLFEHSGQFVDGPITVKTLGSIEWKNNAYWTSDKLYPVGYQSLVVVDKIGWQCHIDRGAEGPSFQITLIKAVPAIVFAESLPNTAWQRAMEFLNAASSSDKEQWQEEFPKTLPLSHNEDGFGLSRPLICQMIEGLDHVEACIGYVMWDERNGTTLDDLITTKSNLTQQLTTGNARGPKLLKKMEELRQRRRMRLKEAGSSSFESPAMKTRNHESKKAELLEFIEKEQTVRHKRAQILAQDKATRAILASVKSRLASAMKKTAIKTLPKSNSEVKWTRVTPLELFPTEIQRDVLWCWDFLGQYADVLRFRTVVPLPHFCHALALQDKTAPQGDSVMEESSHGRLLATLHFHLLEALLVEFTPYLQMSVTDFKKARPLNLMTWPEVARQMFMVAWDVDNGDVDGNAIRILKGGKTSSDQSILSLRDSLDKRGQALLNNKTAETSPPKIKDYGFGMIVTCDTWDGLGLELAVVDGCVQVQKIKNASHPIIRSRVAAGDVLVCLNGVHVAHMPINELNKYASSAEKPLGLIFSRGDRLVTTKQKSHTPVLTRYANVLKILRAKEASAPFNAPVDASMYPDYYRLVPEPMDLATIEDKLLNDEYDDKDLFIEDVELVWRNCFAYNGEDAPISASARKLAATFSRLVDNYLTSANPFNDEDACRRCCTQYCKDRILLCDRCDGSFHMLCLRPPLDEVPQGEWYCPTCAPFQSEKTGDPDDEDFDGEDSAIGIPQIIRLLSKENYMELTLNERVVVFKGLCELVQMCSSVQSVVLSMEDLAEDQRRELGYSFADALREWNSFGEIDETKFEDKNSTESFVENGVTHPLTDTLLMYLKARTEAELNQDVLPSPFFDNDGPIVSDEVAIIEDDNDDIEATLLEEYGDIQLACRKETNSTTDNPQCFCCQMDKLLFADAELIPAVLAPRTSQIAAHMAKLPDIITEPLVTFVCSDAALPFKCEMDENGHAMITHVEPQCDLEVGGIVLALNSIILDEDSDIKQVMQEAKRPIVVLASKSPSTSVDSKEVYLIQLPSTLVDFPNVAFVSSFCQVQPPCTGFVALCDSIFAYDIIFAIDGTRVVNAEDFQKLWQPNALLCVMRNILDRGISKPPLAQEHYSDIQMELWKIKSFQVSFQAGPLGLALDLEENCVVVRSLTPVSQAIRKVQPDDIILTFNDKSIGKLDDLTEFTDTVRTAPRPATIRFYRSSMALTPPSPTDVLMSVGQILQTSLIEFDGRLIVRGEKNHSFSPGDILTHLNDISIEGVSLSWLHQTLEVLPSKDNMYVRVRPKTDPDVPIMAHEHCISIWNTAVIKGTALQRKLVASSELEEQLKEIAPRTWPLSSNYFRFPGDPNTLYKHDDRSWWSTHQIAALVNSENAKIAEKLYAAFFTPPKCQQQDL